MTDRAKMPEIQIKLDCDVIQADGGTRTAAITGGYVALALACKALQKSGKLKQWPLTDNVAAISCGIHQGTPVLDLDYAEDFGRGSGCKFRTDWRWWHCGNSRHCGAKALLAGTVSAAAGLAQGGIAELTLLQNAILQG